MANNETVVIDGGYPIDLPADWIQNYLHCIGAPVYPPESATTASIADPTKICVKNINGEGENEVTEAYQNVIHVTDTSPYFATNKVYSFRWHQHNANDILYDASAAATPGTVQEALKGLPNSFEIIPNKMQVTGAATADNQHYPSIAYLKDYVKLVNIYNSGNTNKAKTAVNLNGIITTINASTNGNALPTVSALKNYVNNSLTSYRATQIEHIWSNPQRNTARGAWSTQWYNCKDICAYIIIFQYNNQLKNGNPANSVDYYRLYTAVFPDPYLNQAEFGQWLSPASICHHIGFPYGSDWNRYVTIDSQNTTKRKFNFSCSYSQGTKHSSATYFCIPQAIYGIVGTWDTTTNKKVNNTQET